MRHFPFCRIHHRRSQSKSLWSSPSTSPSPSPPFGQQYSINVPTLSTLWKLLQPVLQVLQGLPNVPVLSLFPKEQLAGIIAFCSKVPYTKWLGSQSSLRFRRQLWNEMTSAQQFAALQVVIITSMCLRHGQRPRVPMVDPPAKPASQGSQCLRSSTCHQGGFTTACRAGWWIQTFSEILFSLRGSQLTNVLLRVETANQAE